MSSMLRIHMNTRECKCVVCGGPCGHAYGVPRHEGELVPNDWPGEWAGSPACRDCYEAHAAGKLPTRKWEPPSQDRASAWDGQKAVEVLIGKGGMALWVDRAEGQPRGASRHGGDLVQDLIELASLQLGLERLEEGIAAANDLPVELLRRMVKTAHGEVAARIEHATRIRPSGGAKA